MRKAQELEPFETPATASPTCYSTVLFGEKCSGIRGSVFRYRGSDTCET